MSHFQCPECGFGDYEVGHLVACTEIYCVVCLGEQGRKIRVERWEEGGASGPHARTLVGRLCRGALSGRLAALDRQLQGGLPADIVCGLLLLRSCNGRFSADDCPRLFFSAATRSTTLLLLTSGTWTSRWPGGAISDEAAAEAVHPRARPKAPACIRISTACLRRRSPRGRREPQFLRYAAMPHQIIGVPLRHTIAKSLGAGCPRVAVMSPAPPVFDRP